jgi:hypothetical protein
MSDEVEIDRYEPDHNGSCEVCDRGPTVTGVKGGEVVFAPGLCGPCCFGTAKAIDPVWWNSDQE